VSVDVAVLYCDARGTYSRLDGVELWDEARDARGYAGPHPVVAHPPCGPWGRLKHLCKHQDRQLGPLAVEQVRRWGGVLEHPQWSGLWLHCGLPRPGELPDEHGGWTLAVNQVDFGHVALKPSWLYVVGLRPSEVRVEVPPGVPTHVVSWASDEARAARRTLRKCSKRLTLYTPEPFALFLIGIARGAGRRIAR
jgi:hypothetical protein